MSGYPKHCLHCGVYGYHGQRGGLCSRCHKDPLIVVQHNKNPPSLAAVVECLHVSCGHNINGSCGAGQIKISEFLHCSSWKERI